MRREPAVASSRSGHGLLGDRSSRTRATRLSPRAASGLPSRPAPPGPGAQARHRQVRSLRAAKPGSAQTQQGCDGQRGAPLCAAPQPPLKPRAAASPVTKGSRRHSHEDLLSCAPDTSAPPRPGLLARLPRGGVAEPGSPGESAPMRKGVMAEVVVPVLPRWAGRGLAPFTSAFRHAPAAYPYARASVSRPRCSPGSTATCRPSLPLPALFAS